MMNDSMRDDSRKEERERCGKSEENDDSTIMFVQATLQREPPRRVGYTFTLNLGCAHSYEVYKMTSRVELALESVFSGSVQAGQGIKR
jgi:hypothetical protein